MLLIASWNINSIRIRLNSISDWIEKRSPDIILFQEIKCQTNEFPYTFFIDKGYENIVEGQKARNGVAIVIKKDLLKKKEQKINNKINFNNQSRFMCYYLPLLDIYLCNIYVPNGNPTDDVKKYNYKVDFFLALKKFLYPFIINEKKIIIGGDFNVIENKKDVKNFELWKNDALGKLQIRKSFRELISLGYLNVCRFFFNPGEKYSFWDYQKMAWEQNNGLLIDHFLVSPKVIDKTVKFGIDNEVRGLQRPSDHVPIWMNLNI
ncbi:MAG: exodeoxyribonuclease III [Rickettsiales bacterium]|nr:exodeoxyribonuclease III [Rickettsiales bacterium]OUV52852.1 MAG: exodeoxyribonuclease III [Rickettsiales bacterium TMED127]|tara:strand:- start:7255 stop:8043 length:789 start_codon:yes stop_codon:yes gene_type:complete